MWEYETYDFLRHSVWTSLDYVAEAEHWGSDETNSVDDKPSKVHIDYMYLAVPEAADLYGAGIEADLETNSSFHIETDVDDVDSVDGTVEVGLQVAPANILGFGISTNITIQEEDCCEAIAVATWGFSSTDGLGATSDPQNNKVMQKSSEPDDGSAFNDWCFMLPGTIPSYWLEHHPRGGEGSHSAAATISRPKSHVVQAEWSGYVRASTSGTKPGKYAKAHLRSSSMLAAVRRVVFAP